jgi:glycosyltransferase involved in cell wall biosynthesis
LAYPSISKLPETVESSQLIIEKADFTFHSMANFFKQLSFIKKNKIKYIYFSDRANIHWRYLFYRLIGVKKIIVHDHTPGLRTKPSGFKKWFKTFLNRLPFFTSDGSIGATDFVRKRLIDVSCIPESRCFSAPNGIPDISEDNQAINLTERFNILAGKTVIVSVGRAHFYKGVDFSIKVISELVNQLNYRNIHFLYLGDGPHLDEMRKMSEDYNITDYVTLAGRVRNIEEILPACHIAFHPSKGEVGYSLSILECMQARLPVVVSNNASVCEAITNDSDGIIYEQGNINSAVKAFQELLDKPEVRAKMGQSAFDKVKEKYLLKNCHDALVVAITNIIGTNKSE